MVPGHLAVAYLLYSLLTYGRYRRSLTAAAAKLRSRPLVLWSATIPCDRDLGCLAPGYDAYHSAL